MKLGSFHQTVYTQQTTLYKLLEQSQAAKLSFTGGIAVSDLWNQVKMQFKDFPAEIRDRIQAEQQEVIEEAVLSERICSIEKATLALLEASVPRDQIVALLQKHWDLRRSEANKFIEEAENTSSCS